MSLKPSSVIHLPRDLVKKTKGYAIDIGGSAVKLVQVVAGTGDEKLAEVRLYCVGKDRLQEVLEFVKLNLSPPEDGVLVTTGSGTNLHQSQITSYLGLKLDNKIEFMCTVKAFHIILKCAPHSSLFYEHDPEVIRKAEEVNREMAKVVSSGAAEIKIGEEHEAAASAKGTSNPASGVEFPCMLITAGSGCSFVKLEENEMPNLTGVSNQCGAMFMGLGSLLTGAKSYEELVELATKGTAKTVNTMSEDHRNTDSNDLYSSTPAGFPVFGYGHAYKKSPNDFSREDLARTILNNICANLVLLTNAYIQSGGIKTLVFSGSFIESQAARDDILGLYKMFLAMQPNAPNDVKFLKMGPFLACIGALLFDVS